MPKKPGHGRSVRILGLDVGSKTIGVALSDELLLCAHPQKTLSRQGTKKDVETLLLLCKQHQVTQVVVGLPYDCEGNEGHRAKRVRVLGDALSAAGLQIEYQDESFSTVEAEDILLAADLSRARRKEVVDRLAAAVILQAWLDSHRPKQSQEESW
ncbi:MAG TPA: Holliday junction resolvase RuvX [Pseudomonadota bacterium]|nr:Holliday junction resolvase RuvX [Pseudomonadota bacterium]HNN53492.1 Holliday junction resolvase RuvX [Pseudomonadota bacterium]